MTDIHQIKTNSAPAAVGPYSQAIVVNGFVYTAGQIALVPGTRKMVEGGIKEQTRKALENLDAILEAAGTNLSNVVKTTVFLKDMNDFAAMNEVYEEIFGAAKEAPPPARSAVQVVALPLDALVEIEAVAVL